MPMYKAEFNSRRVDKAANCATQRLQGACVKQKHKACIKRWPLLQQFGLKTTYIFPVAVQNRVQRSASQQSRKPTVQCCKLPVLNHKKRLVCLLTQ